MSDTTELTKYYTYELNAKQQKYYDLANSKLQETYAKFSVFQFRLSYLAGQIFIGNTMKCSAHYIGYLTNKRDTKVFKWGHQSKHKQRFAELIKILKDDPHDIFERPDIEFLYYASELWFMGKILNFINKVRDDKIRVNSKIKVAIDNYLPSKHQYYLLYLPGGITKTYVFLINNVCQYKKLSRLYRNINSYIMFIDDIVVDTTKLNNEQSHAYNDYIVKYYQPFMTLFAHHSAYMVRLERDSRRIQLLKPANKPNISVKDKHVSSSLNIEYEADIDMLFYVDKSQTPYYIGFDLDMGGCSKLMGKFGQCPQSEKYDSESMQSILCYAGLCIQLIMDNQQKPDCSIQLNIDFDDMMLASFEIGKNMVCFALISKVEKVPASHLKITI